MAVSRRRRGPGAAPSGRRRRGFSLIEVMIALSILAFGMLAATAGQIAVLRNARQSRSQMVAMYLAQQQMETFQAMDGSDVIAAAGDPNYPNDPTNPIDPDPGDGDVMQFTRRWFITPNSPESGMISLRVEVDWVDPLGFTRTTTLESLKVDL